MIMSFQNGRLTLNKTLPFDLHNYHVKFDQERHCTLNAPEDNGGLCRTCFIKAGLSWSYLILFLSSKKSIALFAVAIWPVTGQGFQNTK